MQNTGRSLKSIAIGVILCLLAVQLVMAAIGPYMGVIGLVLTIALIAVVVGGLGFVGYRVWQNTNERNSHGGM